ncbi:MAG: hypothetical protein IPH20_03220 [Bacteroidales bacterium]|nr:hypothetical protein [Bacteroidales bacterium]
MVVFIVFILLHSPASLQAQDTITQQPLAPNAETAGSEVHSAHKATIYSLVLPGLGQAYNKKYWKIPIIYAGFGALAYSFKINYDETKKFTEAYRYVTNNDSFPIDNEYITRYPDPNDLLQGRAFYRRRVELTVIFSAAWYILNVLDAAVDAHFFDYDISDNLSLRLDPVFLMPTGKPDRFANGIRLSLTL